MKASVIITSYNYGRFLPETIESALAQTYPQTEVVVVDDGSRDNSREVISSFGDRIIAVLKENGGQGSAFNAGVAASRGDVVCFLDSDDLLLPEAVARAVPMFHDRRVAKVNWPLWIIDAESRRTGAVLPKIENLPDGDFKQAVIRDGPFYDWNITPPTSGNAWSRHFLEQIFPMPEAPYRVCADEYLLTLAPIYGEIRKITEPLSCYRSHGHNHGWQHPFDDAKIEDDLQRFEQSSHTLSKHLERMQITGDADAWKQRNFNYVWMSHLKLARQDLMRLTTPGSTIILVDEYEWGKPLLPGRHTISPVEEHGQYSKHPGNDAEAIAVIEQLRQDGAHYLAFWWTAFWWLERYPGLARFISSSYKSLLDSEHLKLFILRHP